MGYVEFFIENLKSVIGNKLDSVILYGSKASGEEVEKISDWNILILIDDLCFFDLKKIKPIIKEWVKKGNTMPAIFSTDDFRKSCDVFPIEFLDMKQNHKVLFGKDVFEEININMKNLRHQCEYELKSNLLKLKNLYILSKDNEREIIDIIVKSINSFLVIFKGIIYLIGEHQPLSKKIESLRFLSRKINFDIEPFLIAVELRKDKGKIKVNFEQLLEKYITEIEKIINFVDNMKFN